MGKREEILVIAAGLFYQKGYAATSMKDIAKAAGMEAASLYNHIQSKQEILQVLLLDITCKFSEGLTRVKEKYPAKNQLVEAIKMHAEVAFNNKNVTALILQDYKHLQPEVEKEFLASRKSYQEAFKQLISEAVNMGVIKAVNPDLILNNILSVLRWIYNPELYENKLDISLDKFQSELLDFIFTGIAPSSKLPS